MSSLRQVLRSLLKSPGFAGTAVTILALCIGANLTIFAIVDSLLLRPLPFPHPDRLVTIFNSYPKAGIERDGASLTNYYERRGRIAAFSELALFRAEGATVGESGATERVPIARVSPEFFTTLGVMPALGRAFREEETGVQIHDAVILTDACWRERFDADPRVLGRTLRVNEVPRKIVGVLPAGFRYLSSPAQFFLPLTSAPENRGPAKRHSGNSIDMIARLRPGVTLAQAQAQIDAHDASVAGNYPQARLIADAGFRSVVASLQADHVRAVRPMLLLLQAGAALLLLLGAVNLINLLLVRASARAREFAVRRALGAAPRHVIAAAMVETTFLTVLGTLGGVILGAFGIDVVRLLGGDQLPLGAQIAFSEHAVAIACLGALALGLALAIPVAWFHLHSGLAGMMQAAERGGGENRSARRLRHGLIVAQLALGFVLLAGAGVLGISLHRVSTLPPGFRPDHVLSGQLTVPAKTYQGAPLAAFAGRLVQEIASRPGITAVGLATNLPLAGNDIKSAITVEGHAPHADESIRGYYTYGVTGDYFPAMGIPLRRGRALSADDSQRDARVCVVDDAFARLHWPEGDAIGQRLFDGSQPGDAASAFTVVGVVGAVKHAGLTETPPGAVYFPFSYRADFHVFVVARATLPPETLGAMLQRVVRQLDPGLPLSDLRSMDARLDDSLMVRRSPALIASLFAMLALLLAAVGTYGVVSYTVAQRRREIGVRLALGARPGQIRGQFLALGLRLLAIGAVLGLGGAWCVGRVLQTILFNVPAFHLATLAATTGVLAAASLLACWLPARRATRINPIEALRTE